MNIYIRKYQSTKSYSSPLRGGAVRVVVTFFFFLLSLLLLSSCGPSSDRCSLDGQFLKMNQGEFRVYSPDGSITSIDTIVVRGGRFEYEMNCNDEGVIVIIMPNMYELPVFVAPGKEITLKADATHIRYIEIKGTDANKLMAEWRKSNADMKGAQLTSAVETFVREHPLSIVSCWLIYKYMICQNAPDYTRIKSLLALIQKAIDDNGNDTGERQRAWVARMTAGVNLVAKATIGSAMPKFTATDIYGRQLRSDDYTKGYLVVTLIADHNYESQTFNRMLRSYLKSDAPALSSATASVAGSPAARSASTVSSATVPAASATGSRSVTPNRAGIKVITLSIDPSVRTVKDQQHRDSLPWPLICDQQMWKSTLVQSLGMTRVPDNILIKDGRIVARTLTIDELKTRLSQ